MSLKEGKGDGQRKVLSEMGFENESVAAVAGAVRNVGNAFVAFSKE
jgi:hypothetical protein